MIPFLPSDTLGGREGLRWIRMRFIRSRSSQLNSAKNHGVGSPFKKKEKKKEIVLQSNLFPLGKIRDVIPHMNNPDYFMPEMQNRMYCKYV
jgi:hypothetical protein